MVSNHLDWLNRWHATQNKNQAFEIDAMPEGGWRLKVPLDKATLAEKPFSPVSRRRTQQDWVDCWVEGQDFQATAGPMNLSEALRILRDWSKKPAKQDGPNDKAA